MDSKNKIKEQTDEDKINLRKELFLENALKQLGAYLQQLNGKYKSAIMETDLNHLLCINSMRKIKYQTQGVKKLFPIKNVIEYIDGLRYAAGTKVSFFKNEFERIKKMYYHEKDMEKIGFDFKIDYQKNYKFSEKKGLKAPSLGLSNDCDERSLFPEEFFVDFACVDLKIAFNFSTESKNLPCNWVEINFIENENPLENLQEIINAQQTKKQNNWRNAELETKIIGHISDYYKITFVKELKNQMFSIPINFACPDLQLGFNFGDIKDKIIRKDWLIINYYEKNFKGENIFSINVIKHMIENHLKTNQENELVKFVKMVQSKFNREKFQEKYVIPEIKTQVELAIPSRKIAFNFTTKQIDKIDDTEWLAINYYNSDGTVCNLNDCISDIQSQIDLYNMD